MSEKELTFVRPLDFSQWHRSKLPRFCACIDIDFHEYCDKCKQPLALIEVARNIGQPKPTTITRNLARKAGIPAYLILYEIGPSTKPPVVPRTQVCWQCSFFPKGRELVSFKVRRIAPDYSELKDVTEEDLIHFFEKMHNPCPICGWRPDNA